MHRSDLDLAWSSWIDSMGPWHVFGGLTYDPKRRFLDRYGFPVSPVGRTAIHDVMRWLRHADKLTQHRLEAAVVAMEFQKNGWPHFHPLLRLAGGLRGDEFAQLGQDWYAAHGYARLEAPRDQVDVAAYASKYLVKELDRGTVVLWPPRGSMRVHQDALIDQVVHQESDRALSSA